MSLGRFKKIGAALLLSSVLLVACGGGEERQAQYLNKAQEYFDQENMDKAKIEVKNVLQINPNNADARYLLGMISEQDKNFRSAFKHFNTAVGVDKNHIKSLNKLASYYLMSKDVDGAEEKVDVVLAIDPDNADALATLAAISMSQEKKGIAIEKAQQALMIEPGHVQATTVLTAIYSQENPEMAMEVITKGIANQSKNESLKSLKIRLLASQKKQEEAVALFKELINEHPDNLMYVMQLTNYQLSANATLENEAERKDQAEKTLRDAVASNPEEEQFKLWLVEFLLKNRGLDTGRDQLETFVAESPDNFVMRDQLAKLYLGTKDVDKATALYQHVVDNNPEEAIALEARNRLVTIALSQEDREKAELLLADIFAIEPENSNALITRAKLKLSDKDFEGAIPDLRVVLKNDPESIAALSLLARAHEINNSLDLALDNYQRLLAVNPKNMQALVGSGRLLIAKNQIEDAMSVLEAAKEIDDSHVEVLQLLTDLYSREQRWDDALSTAAKLTENDKTMAMGYYLQGRVHLRKKDFVSAVDKLEKSIEIEPSGVETISALVSAYLALEQLDKAIAFVEAHSKKYPELIHVRELLANLYVRNGDTKAATTMLESILEDDPNKNSAYIALARIYVTQEKMEKAEGLFLGGLNKNADNNGLRLILAEYYQTQKRYGDAVKVYEELLKSNPDSIVIKNNLASLLMDHFNTPANLSRVAELASDMAATETPAFLDTAGWAQYQLGNYPQAVALLGAAVETGGKGPVYHYHLGMAYFKSDMKSQAKEQLELALANTEADFVGKNEAVETLKLL